MASKSGKVVGDFVWIEGTFNSPGRYDVNNHLRQSEKVEREILVKVDTIREISDLDVKHWLYDVLEEEDYEDGNILHHKSVNPETKLATYHLRIPVVEMILGYGDSAKINDRTTGLHYTFYVRSKGYMAKEWAEILYNAKMRVEVDKAKAIHEALNPPKK